MIVGFPSERVEERIETYTFLSTLRNRYKNVSYNINVLMLDVASDLFKNFQKYNISSIRFPCSPSEFLGNMVDFDCLDTLESRESIDIKRNEFMRDTLYPWMPITAQIKPNIFYRLSETIRNTLIWCCNPEQMEHQLPKEADFYTKNKYLSEWKDSDEYLLAGARGNFSKHANPPFFYNEGRRLKTIPFLLYHFSIYFQERSENS